MAMAGDTDANELTVENQIDEVLLKLVLQKKLEVSTIIKVDGIPIVEPKGFDHLQQVITNYFSQFGKILRYYYPKSEKGHTSDHLYIEYEEYENALKAVKRANNSKLSELTLSVQIVYNCKKIESLLQPIPDNKVQYFSGKSITSGQYYVNKNLNKRIQDWMHNVPHIPELEKRKMIAEAQLAMNKYSTKF